VVNDRGPFKEAVSVDLSLGAAKALDLISKPATGRVRLERTRMAETENKPAMHPFCILNLREFPQKIKTMKLEIRVKLNSKTAKSYHNDKEPLTVRVTARR